MAERTGPPLAFVTGVSRGLGAALAIDLLQRGFAVVGIGRSAHAALVGSGFRLVEADLADVARLDAVATAAFADAAARAPSRAILLNNAATAHPTGPIGTLEATEILAAVATNLSAPLILANAFVRAFVGHGAARVVNVSSGAAERPLPGCVAYCAAKAGLEMIAAVLAAEETAGVEAATVRPGIVDTPMQHYMRSQPTHRLPIVGVFQAFHAGGSLQSPAETARRIVERVVLGDVASGAVVSYQDLLP